MNKQILVLLHGWGWHAGIWQPLVPELSKYYQLVMPNIAWQNSFSATADTLLPQLPQKAIYVGWSLGGMLAWWLASHYPERISALMTLASSPKFVKTTDWPGMPLATLQKFSQALENNYEKTLEDFLELQLRGTHIASTDLKKILFQHKIPLTELHNGLTLLRENDLRNDLKKINCNSLHWFGRLDTIVPVSVTESLQPLLAHGQCEIIPRTGHIPFLSHQDYFVEQLKSFTTNII